MKVNWDDDIPNIWENKKWQPNHQPENIQFGEAKLDQPNVLLQLIRLAPCGYNFRHSRDDSCGSWKIAGYIYIYPIGKSL